MACKASSRLIVHGIAEGRTDERKHLYREARLVADFKDGSTILGRATGNGKNNLFDVFNLRNFPDIGRSSSHQDSTKTATDFTAVVINNAHGQDLGTLTTFSAVTRFAKASVRNFRQKQFACATRTNNHRALVGGILATGFDEGSESILDQVAECTYSRHRKGAGQK